MLVQNFITIHPIFVTLDQRGRPNNWQTEALQGGKSAMVHGWCSNVFAWLLLYFYAHAWSLSLPMRTESMKKLNETRVGTRAFEMWEGCASGLWATVAHNTTLCTGLQTHLCVSLKKQLSQSTNRSTNNVSPTATAQVWLKSIGFSFHIKNRKKE